MKSMLWAACLGFFISTNLLPTTAHAGNCRCYKALKGCLNMPTASIETCTDKFEKCITACEDKKECIKECTEHKKDYKKACKERFKETECPLKGKEAKACKKEAKQKKNRCLKMNNTMTKICKSKCRK